MLIDLSSVGRLDSLEQSALRRILFAVDRRDPRQLGDALLDLAPINDVAAAEQLERALADFMSRRLGPGMMPAPRCSPVSFDC
ncbi:MAG: hypothetical protein M3024_03395 [Candidatus Dormibacteraeota bacterium]|nr:hypothetical protein [Candidatus Dormibacteraeota bacterium]